jgi:DNA repair protein RecN (Recombination protein N)
VRIDFAPGLNVLTGETGAGKSLLLDAMQLALGARGGADLVRPGSAQARVSALFHLPPGSAAARSLAEQGVEAEDGDVLLLREVARDGRSACRVNGRPCTQAMLRQVGAALVALVGQGAVHRFATAAGQMGFLDAYGGAELLAQRARVGQAHARWVEQLLAVQARGTADERQRRRQVLAEDLADIDGAAPQADEEEGLFQRRELLVHAERLAAGVEAALQALREGDDAVGDRLAAVRRDLEGLSRLDPALREPAGLVEQAWIAVDEACHALGRHRERLRPDPVALQALEERWAVLQRLKRRFGGTLAEVLRHRDEAAAELAALDAAEARAAEAAQRLHEAALTLGREAAALGALRRQAAARLEAEVGRELQELGMAAARFGVTVTQEEDPGGVPADGRRLACGPLGADRVTFTWAANAGLPDAPLARAASGGELSRLLLALHALRATEVDVGTIVFDEIDAGVGGHAARAVADRLQRLGAERQVLCVTHQAVIAAAADRHVAITKEDRDGLATACVVPLVGPSRVDEVARMLDGARGRASRLHAEELLRGLARPRPGTHCAATQGS